MFIVARFRTHIWKNTATGMKIATSKWRHKAITNFREWFRRKSPAIVKVDVILLSKEYNFGTDGEFQTLDEWTWWRRGDFKGADRRIEELCEIQPAWYVRTNNGYWINGKKIKDTRYDVHALFRK